jgi:hypothetical protein
MLRACFAADLQPRRSNRGSGSSGSSCMAFLQASLISNWKNSTFRTESGLADLKLEKFPHIERNQASLISNWKNSHI